ncbi:hypothetical protein BS50DRAFT_577566 [Corynespora cassiicola Philippines]|uniref:J domain-containing protein n=1 Tax=Corynespora cassiicola Philippines TaxID=1448308 RepID=A0A2T2NB35_CORCC|nr:hypothetical protein BS50DRAFT_577566 [Corynespora cassiicola Philippines]
MLTKPPLVLSSYSYACCGGPLPSLCHAAAPLPPLSSCASSPLRLSHGHHQHHGRPQSKSRCRTYAQHAPSNREAVNANSSLHPDLSWPVPVHPHTTPTPYQILACQKGTAYTKHRFVALVKLYHPDRCHPSSPVAQLPHAVRLERYRLLVAAHTILADDAKRRAYDLWGAGWTGHHHAPAAQTSHEWSERRTWPSGHDPMMNATWEDWERWYRREYGGDQADDSRAVHMSNFAFVSLVFALVSLGGIMQGTRANMFSTSVMEHRDRIHREASMELARSKRATISGDRSERIRTFVEHREATMAGEDAYQRMLPHPETCAPDTVRKH